MARFIGTLNGSRGPASRLGTHRSGIRATARGWRVGASASVDARDYNSGDESVDVVSISLTSGSTRDLHDVSFGQFTRADLVVLQGHSEALSNLIRNFIAEVSLASL